MKLSEIKELLGDEWEKYKNVNPERVIAMVLNEPFDDRGMEIPDRGDEARVFLGRIFYAVACERNAPHLGEILKDRYFEQTGVDFMEGVEVDL